MEEFKAYIDEKADRFVAELQRLCRQPSIAAQKVGVEETAEMVLSLLQRIGAQARLISVAEGAPVVYGTIGEGKRTLIFYNHYDVQPPEPLEEWESGPFAAEIRQGVLYARGAADNKGDLVARLMAVEAYQKTRGELPLKIKFVFEGEEETGSVHLGQFVEENRGLLEADGCIWEGGSKDLSERPVIYLGVKGILYVELRAKGAKMDLHSSWATLVPNPAWRLVWALASLKDENDHLTVDGLMEHVGEPPPEETDLLRKIPFEEKKLKADFGIPHFVGGVKGAEALKRYLYGPTCTICGFRSGYIGEGPKTVLPSEAMVKLDFRLVPDLEPGLVLDLLRKHLDRRGFKDVEIVEVTSEKFAKSPPDAPIVQAALEAARTIYGQEPVVYPLSAGSGPMYHLSKALGIPAVSAIGVSHAQSRIHAPNENIKIADYIQGIKYIGELIERFAEKG
ncbi:MAG: M20/M25/M40 family metallo-hydrolase [Anaerolineae bacterium]|nr:M20/M25/M40 family metallo-hydrolase [Anaerolineae bacterium]